MTETLDETYAHYGRLIFKVGNISEHQDKSGSWRAGYRDGINSNPLSTVTDSEYLVGYSVGISDIKHFS